MFLLSALKLYGCESLLHLHLKMMCTFVITNHTNVIIICLKVILICFDTIIICVVTVALCTIWGNFINVRNVREKIICINGGNLQGKVFTIILFNGEHYFSKVNVWSRIIRTFCTISAGSISLMDIDGTEYVYFWHPLCKFAANWKMNRTNLLVHSQLKNEPDVTSH